MALIGARATPDIVQQLPVREGLAGVLDQHRQEAILDRGQMDFLASDRDPAAR